MLSFADALLGVAITIVLAAVAAWLKALTAPAATVAAVFGSVIIVLGGFAFLGLLALFLLASGLVTRYRFEEKARRSVQEGTAGERGISNVLAHIFLPTVLVVIGAAIPTLEPTASTSFLYAAAIAFGAADTFASELGILAGSAFAILTLKRVTPGTNGGVSVRGEVFALIGAAVTAGVGAGLFWLFGTPMVGLPLFLIGVTLAGFVACQVDSVLGETLENRGYLTKGTTNLVAMASAVFIGVAILLIAGAAV